MLSVKISFKAFLLILFLCGFVSLKCLQVFLLGGIVARGWFSILPHGHIS